MQEKAGSPFPVIALQFWVAKVSDDEQADNPLAKDARRELCC